MSDLFEETKHFIFEVKGGAFSVEITLEELYQTFKKRLLDEGFIGKCTPPVRTPDAK